MNYPAMTDADSNIEIPSYYKQTAYYPWQQAIWQQLFTANINSDHFPHAILLSGISGIGKKELAFYLAKGLLCQAPQINHETQQVEPCSDPDPKKKCRACQLFESGNHPDLFHLTTPEDKKVIPVDTVRELIQWSVLNSQLDGKKVVIIEPAEAMNANAANSLLKTLEEPVSNTILILLSNKKQALLATIRSRCQTIDLPLPDHDSSILWLQEHGLQEQGQAELLLSLASGVPLLALNLAKDQQLEVRNSIINKFLSIVQDGNDPVQAAEELSKQIAAAKKAKSKKNRLDITAYDVIYWIDSIVSDLARVAQSCPENSISNSDQYQNLQQLSNRLYLKKILQLSDSINKAYYEIQGSININLLFEKLFIDWKNCKI